MTVKKLAPMDPITYLNQQIVWHPHVDDWSLRSSSRRANTVQFAESAHSDRGLGL